MELPSHSPLLLSALMAGILGSIARKSDNDEGPARGEVWAMLALRIVGQPVRPN